MDGMTLDSLSPEELTALEEAIAKRKAAPDPLSALAGIVQSLMDNYQALQEKVGRLETDFYQKVLGGIDGLYKENLRADGLKAFGEKHGSMFSPFADDFKRVFDKDLIPLVFDYLEELKGEPGFNDEIGGSKLKELAEQIKGRIGPKEAPPAAVEVTAAEVKPEEKPPEAPPEESSDGIDSGMENEIAAMKRKDEARERSREKARTKGAA
jgi:hypothetical protein